ncbi:MAG: roadblock/LC7 domain-containing protein [Methanosarcinaceae archaeon]|nr:roadblock/LC7 domain-containing protein [Methanosarcinaceae archaeon]
MTAKLVDKIERIEGVIGSAIVSKDGTIIESSDISESDASLIAFAGRTAEEITGMFVLGEPKITLIQGSNYRLMVSKYNDGHIGAFIKPDANIKSVKSEIDSVVFEVFLWEY